jgi:hypothetical protein
VCLVASKIIIKKGVFGITNNLAYISVCLLYSLLDLLISLFEKINMFGKKLFSLAYSFF